MSTNKTQNYQLHGWAFGDEFPRAELNANFTKLDTALKAEETARKSAVTAEANARTAGLAGKSRVVTGSYVGNGTDSQTITLGFTPKAVLVRAVNGVTGDTYRTYGALAVTGQNAENNVGPLLALTANGFRAYYSTRENTEFLVPRLNYEGYRYNYLAVQ